MTTLHPIVASFMRHDVRYDTYVVLVALYSVAFFRVSIGEFLTIMHKPYEDTMRARALPLACETG